MSAGAMILQAFMSVSSIAVSPRADGDTNLTLVFSPPASGASCEVGCDFDADGDEWENTNTGAQTNQTVWLDAGSASDVWVEFVRTAGEANWDSHTSGTRYNLGSNQRYNMLATQSGIGSTSKTISGYFRMWDAASGGNTLWTGSTVTWTATATVNSGA